MVICCVIIGGLRDGLMRERGEFCCLFSYLCFLLRGYGVGKVR